MPTPEPAEVTSTTTIAAPPRTRVRERGTALRWVVSVVVLVLMIWLLVRIATNQVIDWSIIASYMFNEAIISGLWLTLGLTVTSMAAGIVIGTALSLMVMSRTRALQWAANTYIWFFRGTPVLVQLIAWFNIGLIFPTIDLFGQSWNTNTLVTPIVAAFLALGLNEGAYMSEIMRAGMLAVDPGQREAAKTVGLTPRQTLFRVVLPQALRVIVPPTANQTIGMLKTTALVSVIGAQDLLTQAQHIYAQNFQTINLLIVASIWYLVLTTIATIGQSWLERRISRTTPLKAIEVPA